MLQMIYYMSFVVVSCVQYLVCTRIVKEVISTLFSTWVTRYSINYSLKYQQLQFKGSIVIIARRCVGRCSQGKYQATMVIIQHIICSKRGFNV
jgi:hypothetical protein